MLPRIDLVSLKKLRDVCPARRVWREPREADRRGRRRDGAQRRRVPGLREGVCPASEKTCARPQRRRVPGLREGVCPASEKACAWPQRRRVSGLREDVCPASDKTYARPQRRRVPGLGHCVDDDSS